MQTNLEITGNPESKGEYVSAMVKDVAITISVKLEEEDIERLHCVPSFKDKKGVKSLSNSTPGP